MRPGRRCLVAIALVTVLAVPGRTARSSPASIDSLTAMLDRGELVRADSSARALLAELDAKGGPDSTRGRAIDALLQSMWQRGQGGGPEGKQLAVRAVELKVRAFGAGHEEVGSSLYNHAVLLAVGGEPSAARDLFERALAVFERRLGPDSRRAADALMGIANVSGDLGDTPSAIRAYERVLPIYEKLHGRESARVGMVLFNIGSTHTEVRHYAEGRAAYARSLAVLEKASGPEHTMVARALIGLGITISGLGDPAAAQPLQERALRIMERNHGPESPHVGRSLLSLATVHVERGDYAGALPLFERSAAIHEKSLGPDHPNLANALNSLAALLHMMGDYTTARPLAERALAIREKAFGADHRDVARSRLNLGVVLEGLNDLQAARVQLERALAVDEKALGPDNPDVALILTALGGVLGSLGDYPGARRMQERGLASREKVLGMEHPSICPNLDYLTDLYWYDGDVDAAQASAARSLAIREKALGSDHPDLATSLGNVARIEAARGDDTRALVRALEAVRVASEHVRLTTRTLSERQALQLAAAGTSGLDLALTLSARGLDGTARRRALDALVRSRAAVLDEMAARHRVAGDTTKPEVARAAAQLLGARTRLANLVVRGVEDDDPAIYRKRVDDARVEKEKAEQAMAAVSADYVREASRNRIGLDEVAASLPAGTALCAFAQYRRSDLTVPKPGAHVEKPGDTTAYLAFLLRSGASEPEVVDLGEADEIDRLVVRWKQAAAGDVRPGGRQNLSESRYRDEGTALRKKVWDPVASALQGARTVFVVPDGSLNLVNLAALPDDAGGYLVERDPTFHHLSAERDLVPAAQAAHGQGLLALGGADFDAALTPLPGTRGRSVPTPPATVSSALYRGPRSSCGDLAGARFEPLAGTAEETREIASLWRRRDRPASGRGAVLDLREGAATESALKRDAPGRRVLHLATHGFFLGEDCVAPSARRGIGGIGESPARTDAAPAPAVSAESPLLRSGLVLAGANHRSRARAGEDDGILTAEEIASLDLSGVEWAVLSACGTGVGDVRAGEGVFGLRRAFQVAGAGTLIMSLWSVDDEATRAWMKALYQGRLEQNLDTAASVRRASLEALRQRRARKQDTHPFYWAAFVAAGDWR